MARNITIRRSVVKLPRRPPDVWDTMPVHLAQEAGRASEPDWIHPRAEKSLVAAGMRKDLPALAFLRNGYRRSHLWG